MQFETWLLVDLSFNINILLQQKMLIDCLFEYEAPALRAKKTRKDFNDVVGLC
jgi:hypothetical protein